MAISHILAPLQDRLLPARQGGYPRRERSVPLRFETRESRSVQIATQYAVIAVHCPCGDATSVTLSGYDETEAPCPCGRTWQVRVTAELDATD